MAPSKARCGGAANSIWLEEKLEGRRGEDGKIGKEQKRKEERNRGCGCLVLPSSDHNRMSEARGSRF
jgi:hypothetical protein